ncbi:MAG: hypothetical protein ACI8Z1_000581 [Candidatus Azotimanducaceae bacterium]|jgi:hypothetical protein
MNTSAGKPSRCVGLLRPFTPTPNAPDPERSARLLSFIAGSSSALPFARERLRGGGRVDQLIAWPTQIELEWPSSRHQNARLPRS